MTDEDKVELGTIHIKMYKEGFLNTKEFLERMMKDVGLTREQVIMIALQMVVGGLK